jgi:hypothetical protein
MAIKPKKSPITKALGAGAKAVIKAVKPTAAKSTAKANARGLKAANKPTNMTGKKADRADRRTFQGDSNLIKNADPARPNRIRGGSLGAMKAYGGFGVATAKRSPKQAAWQKEISKELNPARKKKAK